MTDLDPETVTLELNQAAHAVFRASNHLKKLSEEFDGAEGELGIGVQYDIALEDELAEIYESSEGKPPAEDIRKAMAKARVRTKQPDLDANYRRLSTEIKATQVWISNQKAVLSARQSVLSATKVLSGLGA